MSNATSFRVDIEVWNVDAAKVNPKAKAGERKHVNKIATRNHLGQFHGSTNFVGSLRKF